MTPFHAAYVCKIITWLSNLTVCLILIASLSKYGFIFSSMDYLCLKTDQQIARIMPFMWFLRRGTLRHSRGTFLHSNQSEADISYDFPVTILQIKEATFKISSNSLSERVRMWSACLLLSSNKTYLDCDWGNPSKKSTKTSCWVQKNSSNSIFTSFSFWFTVIFIFYETQRKPLLILRERKFSREMMFCKCFAQVIFNTRFQGNDFRLPISKIRLTATNINRYLRYTSNSKNIFHGTF